ncbi:MAG: bifunctional diaminohydroxyphosphoribosylaminopyrimidine deaminase/5-amino-6-(5-phosphoribosylamino)uracil reductase RibD [Bacteroidetes bacterium]|nr:bifunctional diaminohydroxyphosphoribosylaminopyrimidine deaminase/5-amino-6-(5-phosphoribosylamino)uracil reductase RibD [Bacteroidota bacterium]MCW5896299.1 bifunctional diaminohydroxyphosphoribosylaminopyrimidine deaminase/5-amino-6-(5-phosphoribosylamino)uracil reductase RibD [Bacteroidota bacterium]
MAKHEQFMRECFRLAEKGKGHVSPNPLVGAVLVEQGRSVAFGFHERFGGSHAEVNCLRNHNGNLSNAVLYVNLEPCSHFGKTPPCTDLLVQRGIRNVVVAMKDPNPFVSGKGIAQLRRAGVHVTVGVLEKEAGHLNRFFVKHIVSSLPYVHLKIAETADGFIGRGNGSLEYITSLESRRLVHLWRGEYDAIVVGAGTIQTDNPELNVRLSAGRDPAVVILDGNLRLTGQERVFASARKRRVFLCVSQQAIDARRTTVRNLESNGVTLLAFAAGKGDLNLKTILRELYARQIGSILVEGGSNVFSRFIKYGFVDELSVFCSPAVFGKGIPRFPDAKRSNGMLREMLLSTGCFARKSGTDTLFTGIIA